MIIKRIRIYNFQAHKKLCLDLADFTAITGVSSSGKTAIFRALQWLFYGEWDATYPNDPEQPTAVAIDLENGVGVARWRKGTKNRAVIRIPDQEPITFEDFGAIIPGIYNHINVRPIQAGARSVNLNFSGQEDPVFMIHESWSGPAKASWLGRLYGAHIITSMLRMMSADKREHESNRKRLSTEIDALDVRLDSYGDTAAQKEAIASARQMVDRMAKLEFCAEEINSILQKRLSLDSSRHLMNTDLGSLRSDAMRLQTLRTALENHDSTKMLIRSAAARTPLLKVNLDDIRTDLNTLSTLRNIAAFLDESQKDSISKKHLLGKVNPKIEAMKCSLRDHLIRDGKCLVCQSDTALAPQELADNLKTVMGV